ncbi:UNVERIFIED_CONTAM: hypothetical protein K2H54_045637 [Gekko kuhli]
MNAWLSAPEHHWRQLNLKLRGMAEGVQQGKDVEQFVSEWLASELELEDGQMVFLKDALDKLAEFKQGEVIIGCDLNSIIDNTMDHTFKSKQKSKSRKTQLYNFLEAN